jgi:beta-xylosidase
VLACGRPLGYIDPFAFVDPETGQAWLYLARADPTCHRRHGRCFIATLPLSSDLTQVIGEREEVLGVTEPWERTGDYETVENPYVFYRGGSYYLLYSANDWRSPDYAMGYAVGPTPIGPFSKLGLPLMSRTASIRGPGGGSLVEGPSGGLWMAYHARRRGLGDPRRRLLHIDPVALLGRELITPGPTRVQALAP